GGANVVDVGQTNVRITAVAAVDADAMYGGITLMIGGARTAGGPVNGVYVGLGANGQANAKMYGPNTVQVGGDFTVTAYKGGTSTFVLEYNGTTITLKQDGVTIKTGTVALTGTRVGFHVEPPSGT